ncbi:neurotrophin 1 [Schistocerca cancellata]|uniref:neurotrophin 1 n=1 Tax=Schistocerca cancellata TaxID=274614 RepID=UPI0021199E47|nr:neurotrophin 1 [Schistocerca cancellata]
MLSGHAEPTVAQKETDVYRLVSSAMRQPSLRRQLSQILPIVRAMTPAQRLALAAMKLLLPLSWDIANLITASAAEADGGRLLRAAQVSLRTRSLCWPQHRLEAADNDPEPQSCNLVANDLCLESDDYPDSAILASIRRSQGSMDAMLLDSGQRSTSPAPAADRRPDSPLAAALTSSQTSESGTASLCASRTQLARPRRARATSGQWKFVVNVGEYTQTLRLDLCLKPRESCGLLPDNVESRCQQVYNYHRLLTWDNERGLHMDIFKVPTCCTCQVTAVHPLLQRPSKQPTQQQQHQQQQQAGAKHHDVDNDADAAAVVPSRLPSITTPSSAPTTPPPSFLPTRHGFRRPSTHPVTGSPGYLPPRGPPLPLADHGGADVDSRLSWLKRNRSSLYNRYPPRRPKPHVISSDSIRRGATTRQPQAPSPPTLPTPPDAATPSPDGLSVGAASGPHRRVNYSYHPIIDYIRQQQLAEQPTAALQSRSGEGWTPIEGGAAA